LDAVARRALYDELIGELADRGTTALVTTHDLDGIETIADRVAVLDGARLVVNESLEDLKARFRRVRCGAAPNDPSWGPLSFVAATDKEWGSEAVATNFTEERLQQFRAASRNEDVEVDGMSLEEIFLALVGTPRANVPGPRADAPGVRA